MSSSESELHSSTESLNSASPLLEQRLDNSSAQESDNSSILPLQSNYLRINDSSQCITSHSSILSSSSLSSSLDNLTKDAVPRFLWSPLADSISLTKISKEVQPDPKKVRLNPIIVQVLRIAYEDVTFRAVDDRR
jgi:hypothetical protein